MIKKEKIDLTAEKNRVSFKLEELEIDFLTHEKQFDQMVTEGAISEEKLSNQIS